MEMFAGKDFLRMQPPKNYKPGIGRGALGFSTRGNIGFDTKEPVDDGAAEIYAQVDKRKRTKQVEEPEAKFADAVEIDESEWLNLPVATDTTFRSKRLRKEQQMTQRTYNLPDKMIDLEVSGPNFSQLTKIDPTNSAGWIGYAKQQQADQHFKKARSIIMKGCTKCSSSPEVWLLAIDIHPMLDDKRNIAARAVDALPNSIELWDKAIEIEDQSTNKQRVVQKALELNPETGKFWTLAASLETDESIKKLVLEQAVALVPGDETLWLQLFDTTGDLEIIENALEVLPHSLPLWATKLYGSKDTRSEFLEHLLSALPAGNWAPYINEHPEDIRIATLLIDKFEISPEVLETQTHKDLAYKSLAKRDPTAYKVWAQQGNAEALNHVLEEEGDLESYKLLVDRDTSLEAIERAFKAFPDEFSEQYIDKLEPLKSLEVLSSIKKTPQLWIKYASLVKHPEASICALKNAIREFPSHGELYVELYRLEPYPEVVEKGLEHDPKCIDLWIIKAQGLPIAKKRALLVQAMAENPRNAELWLERILMEKSAQKDYKHLLETAIKECNNSGKLWYLYLESLDDLKRKPQFAIALKQTDSAGEVLYSLAKFYKARGKDYKGLMEKVPKATVEWCVGV